MYIQYSNRDEMGSHNQKSDNKIFLAPIRIDMKLFRPEMIQSDVRESLSGFNSQTMRLQITWNVVCKHSHTHTCTSTSTM